MLRRVVVGALGAAVILGLGCSEDSESTSGGDVGQFVEKYCAFFDPCCAKAAPGATASSCRTFVGQGASAVPFDAAKIDACLAEMQQKSQSPTFCDDLGVTATAVPSSTCAEATGTKDAPANPPIALGQPCTELDECAPVEGARTSCDGTKCVAYRVGKAGDGPCDYQSGGTAVEIFRCDPKTSYCSDGGIKCAASVPLGAECADGECGADGYCMEVVANEVTTATCVARKPIGAACEDSEECPFESRGCQDGKCEDWIPIGGACEDEYDFRCIAGSICINNACVADVPTATGGSARRDAAQTLDLFCQ